MRLSWYRASVVLAFTDARRPRWTRPKVEPSWLNTLPNTPSSGTSAQLSPGPRCLVDAAAGRASPSGTGSSTMMSITQESGSWPLGRNR